MFVRKAWFELRGDRQMTMAGPAPLPWSAVDRWAKRNNIDGESFDLLWSMLAALDVEYLNFQMSNNDHKA